MGSKKYEKTFYLNKCKIKPNFILTMQPITLFIRTSVELFKARCSQAFQIEKKVAGGNCKVARWQSC